MPNTTDLRARSRAHLVAADVHVERGGRPVLADVTLTVTPGSRLGSGG